MWKVGSYIGMDKFWISLLLCVVVIATIKLYREAEVSLGWGSSIPQMDMEDPEWERYKKVIGYFLGQSITHILLDIWNIEKKYNRLLKIITMMTCLCQVLKLEPTVLIIIIACLFWWAMKLPKLCMIIFLLMITTCLRYKEKVIPVPNDSLSYFHSIVCWMILRAVSFNFDCRERKLKQKFSQYINYIMYPPLFAFGPFVPYDNFRKCSYGGNLNQLSAGLTNAALIAVLMEYISCVLPVRLFSAYTALHKNISLWTICACIFWNGINFSIKYKVIYGVSSALARWDGIEVYRLPCCTARMYSYRKLWEQFDIGMHVFIKKYIYSPTVKTICARSSPYYSTSVAKLASFIFIFVWHGANADVMIWVLVNYVSSIAESLIRRLESKISPTIFHANIWNCILKPVLYAPVTFTSIMGNAILCHSMNSAHSFTVHILRTERLLPILICVFVGIKSAIAVEKMMEHLNK